MTASTPESVDGPVTPALRPTRQPRPPAQRKPRGGPSKTAAARSHAQAERDAGRLISGGQLARQFSIDPSLARRILRELPEPVMNGHG